MTKCPKCPKCKQTSGNCWTQCEGSCPMPESPHYSPPKTEAGSVSNLPRVMELLRLRHQRRGDGLAKVFREYFPEVPVSNLTVPSPGLDYDERMKVHQFNASKLRVAQIEAIVAPLHVMTWLPRRAFNVSSWSRGRAQKTFEEVVAVGKVRGYQVEVIPDHRYPKESNIIVYRNAQERAALIMYNGPMLNYRR